MNYEGLATASSGRGGRHLLIGLVAAALVASAALGWFYLPEKHGRSSASPGRQSARASTAKRPGGAGARKPPRQVVTGIARIGGRTRTVDGRAYQLFALRIDPGRDLSEVGSLFGPVSLLNGHCFREFTPPAAIETGFGTHFDPDIQVLWMSLWPGEQEFLMGKVRDLGGTDKHREWLLAVGYRPLTIRAEEIPVIEAATADELARQVRALPQPAK